MVWGVWCVLAVTARCCCVQVTAFCPTGWMYEMKRSAVPQRSKGAATIHLVPYSEHSSFEELQQYVRWLRPQKVGGGAAGSADPACLLASLPVCLPACLLPAHCKHAAAAFGLLAWLMEPPLGKAPSP